MHRLSTPLIPSLSAARLAVLVAVSREVAAHSAHLVRLARERCAQSAQERGARRVYQEERRAWADILARLPDDPDHMVVLCACCHRVRGPRLWTRLPIGIEYELWAWHRVLLSHGYCPQCMRVAEARISARKA